MTARCKPTICSLSSLRVVKMSEATSALSERIIRLHVSDLGAQIGDLGTDSDKIDFGCKLRPHLPQQLENQAFRLVAH
jgi:hypothetical protein